MSEDKKEHWQELGFATSKEYGMYYTSFWSGWYNDNPGKSPWDADILKHYFSLSDEERSEYLEKTRVQALNFVDVKYHSTDSVKQPSWDEKLIAKYSNMFSHHCKYMSCGKGWKTIIDNLLFSIDACNVSGVEPHVTIQQIKEKFGLLQVYYSGGGEQIKFLVRSACNAARYTCEYCGTRDNVGRTSGWITTCCKSCYDNNKRPSQTSWRSYNDFEELLEIKPMSEPVAVVYPDNIGNAESNKCGCESYGPDTGDFVRLVHLIEKLRKREGGCTMNELVAACDKGFDLSKIKERTKTNE